MKHWREYAFPLALGLMGGSYVVMIALLLAADVAFTPGTSFTRIFQDPAIRASLRLSLLSALVSSVLALWVAVPLGYALARFRFPGKLLVEWLVDIPIVLPPLVLGVSLLIVFQTSWGKTIDGAIPFTYAVAGVILAQFVAVTSFAVRTVRVAFEATDPRTEAVARTLGCTRAGAFWRIAIPEARHGIVSAGLLAWSRALGEFGPVLVFAGATRGKTEVLPTTVYLELSIGNIESAVAVAVVLVVISGIVAGLIRFAGGRP